MLMYVLILQHGVTCYIRNWNILLVMYLGFAWLIRWVLDFMIEFFGPLYNGLQPQITIWHTIIFWLDTPQELVWLPTALRGTPSILISSTPFRNSSAWTPQKTLCFVVKNACLLVQYLAMDVLLLLRVYASEMCFLSRCLAMGIYITIPSAIGCTSVDCSHETEKCWDAVWSELWWRFLTFCLCSINLGQWSDWAARQN
jgi:hypothetical protein